MNFFQTGSLFKLSTRLIESLDSEEKDVINILLNINTTLRSKVNHSKQEYIHLAGTSGSLIRMLQCVGYSNQCYIEASKALHHLTYADPDTISRAKLSDTPLYPPEVTASIQRVIINILKEQGLSSDVFSDNEYAQLIISCLSVLYNLVICAPEEVLGNIILNASHKFVFYKLPGIEEIEFSTENCTLDEDQIREMDADTVSRSYTNRNRRKRLRRKKAQPFRSTLETDLISRPTTHSAAPSKERAVFLPRGPPSADSLAMVSLKPQWIRSAGASDSKTGDCQGTAQTRLEKGIAALEVKDRHPDPSLPPPKKAFDPPGSSGIDCAFIPTPSRGDSFDPNSFPLESCSSENGVEKISALETNVRNCALHTINAVICRAGRQNKFGFWPQLMCQTPSLMTCILKDPSPAVRMTALLLINTFLMDSQQVLSMAVDDKDATAYVTLGRQLGSSIRELHRCLALALISEKSSSSLVRILKTFELLIQNVRYANLKPGLLTKVVTHVKYFLRYKEDVVRANAFSVMVSFLMVKPQVPEIRDLLLKYMTPAPQSLAKAPDVGNQVSYEEELPGEELQEEVEDMTSSEESFSSDSCPEGGSERGTMISWIVQRCLDSLLFQKRESVQGIYSQVQLQSLKVLSAMVSEHLCLIKDSLHLVQHVIMVCCEVKLVEEGQASSPSLSFAPSDPERDVVMEHSFLLLGSLLGSVKSQLEKNKLSKYKEEIKEACVTPQLALQLWLWAFQHPLQVLFLVSESKQQPHKCSSEANGKIKAKQSLRNYPLKPLIASANVLLHLCLHVLQSIGEEMVNQILGVIDFLLKNEELQLKMCGVRVMAIIVAYAPVGESPLGPSLAISTIDVATDLFALEHQNVNKDRLLAAWAVANVFASLAIYRETARNCGFEPLLSKETILRVIRASISGCHDKGKIKPHAVRCLGYTIASISPDLVCDEEVKKEIENSVETLMNFCNSGTNMRIRWNACHALGNILVGEHLPIEKVPWRRDILVNLCSLVERFPNYKVRIQACIAVCGLGRREQLGEELPLVWKSFLKGLEDAQNITDYYEIHHRDEFINELCVGMCQLVRLLRLKDLEAVTSSLLLYQDTAKLMLAKAHQSLPPEQASCFLQASQHLQSLNDATSNLTSLQSQGIEALLNVFKEFI